MEVVPTVGLIGAATTEDRVLVTPRDDVGLFGVYDLLQVMALTLKALTLKALTLKALDDVYRFEGEIVVDLAMCVEILKDHERIEQVEGRRVGAEA